MESDQLLFSKPIFSQAGDTVFTNHSIFITSHVSFADLVKYFNLKLRDQDVQVIELIPDKDLLSIKDVRELQSRMSLRTQNQQVILVKANKLPEITQNSLLKTLEDGSNNTTLIIVILPGASLLPTIISRVLQTTVTTNHPKTFNILDTFYAQSITDRIQAWGDSFTENDLKIMTDQIMQAKFSEYDAAVKQSFLDSYEAWRGGRLLSKYFYEYLCLTL